MPIERRARISTIDLSTWRLHRLLANGHFPKELPPQFGTEHFAQKMLSDQRLGEIALDQCKGKKSSRYCTYSFPKGIQHRRTLALTNPAFQYRLSKVLASRWEELLSPLAQGALSLSRPVEKGVHGQRPFGPERPHKDLYRVQIEKGATARFVVHADIAHYYPSVYTHAISWAVDGREEAKKAAKGKGNQKKGERPLGDELDSAIRDMQDKESIGLPIGPDSSFIIAELLGAQLDRLIEHRLEEQELQCIGYRHYDDIALYFNSEEQARRAINVLRGVLESRHLRLNENKTFITRLPEPFKREWTYELSAFDGPESDDSFAMIARDLNRYFSIAFSAQHELPGQAVLNYALSRFLPEVRRHEYGQADGVLVVPEGYWGTFTSLLCQSLLTRPETASRVFAILRHYKQAEPRFKPEVRLTDAVNTLIADSPIEADHEFAWALTIATYFGQSWTPDSGQFPYVGSARLPEWGMP